MENKILFNGFTAPETVNGLDLKALISTSLKKKGVEIFSGERPTHYWSAEHFGFDRIKYFTEANDSTKEKILVLCTKRVLDEAYYVEKAGSTYASHRAAFSETYQEHAMYSLIAEEEVAHFYMICSLMHDSPVDYKNNAFLLLIENILKQCDPAVLILVCQVFLEGLGVNYYSKMMRGTFFEPVREALKIIVADEIRHHSVGLVTTRHKPVEQCLNPTTVEYLTQFFRMIQCGPQGAVQSLSEALGGLNRQQKEEVFFTLESDGSNLSRMAYLESLVKTSGPLKLYEVLARHDCFRTWSAKECAQL